MSQRIKKHIDKYLYWYASIFSVIGSVIIISASPILNKDGAVYMASSQAFLDGGLAAASEISIAIFYPVLIALVSMTGDFSLLTSAHIINTILLTVLVLAYIYLIKQLGGNRNVQLIGAIIILLNPGINAYRELIFRDQGFWAFSILSLALLLQYSKNNHLRFILLWTICQILAALFRPEALVFMALSPLALLFLPDLELNHKIIRTSKIYLILLTLALLGYAMFYLLGWQGMLDGMFLHLDDNLTRKFQENLSFGEISDKFANLFSYPYPEDYIWLGFGLSLIPILMVCFGGAVSLLMLLLLGYCLFKKNLLFPKSPIYRAYLILSLLVLIIFLINMQFLTPRYCTFFGLLVMTAIPFSLCRIHANGLKSNRIKFIACLFLLSLAVDSFISFGYSEKYLAEGIDWLHQHTAEDSRIMSNDRGITYSIDRGKDFKDSQAVIIGWGRTKLDHILKGYDYFVEDTFWDEDELTPQLYPNAKELARFTSERGNRLVVYDLGILSEQ